jgi:F-box protein 18 (helicase)
MLYNLPADVLELIARYLNMKQLARLRSVGKTLVDILREEYEHTFHVMKNGGNFESLPRLNFQNITYDMDIEYLSRIFRNENILPGLKSKLLFYIHKKESIKEENLWDIQKKSITSEQAKIVNIPVDKDVIVLVQAYAGTGKTRTLVEYAIQNKNKQLLYLAYNKELCDDAKKRFTGLSNVTISTLHSIAYKGNEECEIKSLEITDIVKQYNVSNIQAMKWIREFDKYCHKMIEHTEYSKRIWDDMFENNIFAWTHDAYLKKYQLSQPTLNFDVIMLDEVQDCNDCILEIVNQQNIMKLYVGDVYQKLYGFRNVENPFRYIMHNKRDNDRIIKKRLTYSFRMGFDLMYHVNIFLKQKFKTNDNGFTGCNGSNTILLPYDNTIFEELDEPILYICRFNISVMKLCFKHVLLGKKVYIYGKTFDFDKEIEITNDFIQVSRGNYSEVTHQECKAKSIDSLNQMYTELCMSEWRQRLSLYLEYGDMLLTYWVQMRSYVTYDVQQANTLISTVHQAKGSEFDNVYLHDDLTINNTDSLYIIYVAMTRAKKRVLLNKVVTNYFIKHKGNIYYTNPYGNQFGRCILCNSHTNNNVWMDVDYTSQFDNSDSEALENKIMCYNCQHKTHI